MKTRAITGFVFILVMLASMLTGSETFTIFYVVLSLICLNEFYSLIKAEKAKPQILSGNLLGLTFFGGIALTYFLNLGPKWLLINILVLVGIFIFELFRNSSNPFKNISFTILGVIYTILPFIFYHSLAFISGQYNFHLALGFFVMLWSNDTGAYLAGKFLGKTKLFEKHSPKKTWEGFFGGVLASVIASIILAHYYTEYETMHWISIALIISCFGTLGDLVESMLKRSVNIKDSGSILPGHGGLLDRFDGLLLSAPLVFIYLYFITY